MEHSTDNARCMHPSFLVYWQKPPLNVKTLCCCKSPSLYTIYNLSSLSTPHTPLLLIPLPSHSLSLGLLVMKTSESLPHNVHFSVVITHTRNLSVDYLLTTGHIMHQLQITTKSLNLHFEAQPKRSTHTISIGIMYA